MDPNKIYLFFEEWDLPKSEVASAWDNKDVEPYSIVDKGVGLHRC